MGRVSIYTGFVFALIGLLTGIYVYSRGSIPDLPAPLLFALCPASILAFLSPTSEADTDFLWLLVVMNAAIYGAIGVLVGRLLHVDGD